MKITALGQSSLHYGIEESLDVMAGSPLVQVKQNLLVDKPNLIHRPGQLFYCFLINMKRYLMIIKVLSKASNLKQQEMEIIQGTEENLKN